jgi:hypothetical protein
VNTRRAIKWASFAVLAGIVGVVLMMMPRVRSLPEGYTYLYTPASGHRYIVAPGGIKKVGQEVLDCRVSGSVVIGTVRLRLGSDDVRTFRLDLKTHAVALGERVQRNGR